MSLPAIVMPAELPAWLADGYEAAPGSIYGHAGMSIGASRTRRIVSCAERKERCSLLLTAAMLPIFHEFFEVTLEAGRLPFAARVSNLGAGVRWWSALASYESSTPRPGGLTTISCTLLLRGAPYASGPV